MLSNRLGYHQTPIPDPYRIRNWKRFAQNSLEKGENAKASTVWGGTKNYTHKEKRERRRDPKINAQRLKKREREEVHVY